MISNYLRSSLELTIFPRGSSCNSNNWHCSSKSIFHQIDQVLHAQSEPLEATLLKVMFFCPLATLLSASHKHPPCTNPSLILSYILATLPAAHYLNPTSILPSLPFTSYLLCPPSGTWEHWWQRIGAAGGVEHRSWRKNFPYSHSSNFSPKYTHTKTQL